MNKIHYRFMVGMLAAGMLPGAEKTVPPPGIAVPPEVRSELTRGVDALSAKLAQIRHPLATDVVIYRDAVRTALDHDEFFKADEFDKARGLLKAGNERADALLRGESPWAAAAGLVPRGYISKIDRSVQPYALVLFQHPTLRRYRGRGGSTSGSTGGATR